MIANLVRLDRALRGGWHRDTAEARVASERETLQTARVASQLTSPVADG
jgi:hypothetical protein